jgi:tetratricopeptide (TPR) repeat protein
MTQMLLNQAMALHQQGQLAEAQNLYQQVLAAGPHYQAQYLLAVLFYQQQRLDEAAGAVDAALRLNPDGLESRMLKGALAQGAGRGEEAVTHFAAVTARQPGHAEAWYNQGVALAGLNRHREAVAAFDRTLGLRPNAAAWTNRGVSLKALDRTEEALESFGQALALEPGFAAALYNRGIAVLDARRFAEAVAAFDQMLLQAPDAALAWNNRGVALHGLGRLADALESYDRAVAIQPGYAPGWKNRAITLTSLGRFADAAGSFDKALALNPDDAAAWNGRGDVLRQCARFDDAVTSYDRALALTPDDPDAWSNRAASLQMLRRFDEALVSADRALSLVPGHLHALAVKGSLLCEMGRVPEGMAHYRRRAELTLGGHIAADDAPDHRKRHDAQQRDYLAALGVPADRFHLAGGEGVAQAVNPANARGIAAQWAGSDPKLVVIDDLLTPEALEGLRLFCWGSTIWKKAYPDGYLGAMPDHGFAAPLLAQIADELRTIFPAIFGTHGLGQWWGFTYDSSLSGIRIHADQAAVNVNFWITPDEANRNPANGGLIVWDKKPPLDWDFARSNGDEKSARDFLAQTGARPVTIPYRANRAVIFDSDLFHETDRIEFADGYKNRRINITMLYGRRGDARN